MKKILLCLVLTIAGKTCAQDSTFNKLAVGVRLGFNNPVNPIAGTYESQTLGMLSTTAGLRYMFNPKFGLRLSGGYQRFTNKSSSPDFATDYFAVSLEGVINVGNVLHFHNWTERFGLLFHTGAGYSAMREKSSVLGYDQMMHGVIGITPQFKLNDRFAVSLDATTFAHIYQSRTFDFSASNSKRGVDGFLFNLSVGVQYAIGKNRVYADWVVPVDLSEKLRQIESDLSAIENGLKDDDGDGVANYLDQEPQTPAGAEVNTKGQEQVAALKDSDSDGIADETDDCPFAKGTAASNGCPDADLDGIADKTDNCPLLAGVAENNGCPTIAPSTLNVLAAAARSIQFTPGKETFPVAVHAQLDKVAAELAAHPEYKLVIAVHTDAEGDNLQNLALTQERADALKFYLIGKGIPGSRLTALGFGETQPVASNDTPEGSAANRRVELTLKF